MKYLLNIIYLILLFTEFVIAQSFGSNGSLDARNTALGGTNVTSARGVYALGVNPANLAISNEHAIEISTFLPLPMFNFSAGNDFITINDYNHFFTGVQDKDGIITGRFLDVSEKNKFLSLFDNGSSVYSNIGVNIFSITYSFGKEIGAFGFSVHDWTSFQADLPKDILELFLFGNELGKVYDFSDMKSENWYLRNYSLSYARDLSDYFEGSFKFVSAGLTLKMIHGFFYGGIEKLNTSIYTQENFDILVNGDSQMLLASSPSFGIVYDFEDDDTERKQNIGLFNTPAGTGFGIDLGFYAQIDKFWSVGFALNDLGTISWKKGLAEYSSSGSLLLEDITDDELIDSIKTIITGKGASADPFSTSLSTSMALGTKVNMSKYLKTGFPGELHLEFNYHQGFNNMPANSTAPRFSLGAEWIPLSWFKFRTGFSFGGYDNFNWGMGLGFDSGIIDFDIASAYIHSLFDGNNAKRLGFAFSSRLKF